MGGVTACNWEGKERPRKVGGIAAGNENTREAGSKFALFLSFI